MVEKSKEMSTIKQVIKLHMEGKPNRAIVL